MTFDSIFKRWLITAGACCLLTLAGCSAIGPDFNEMTDAYEKSIDAQQRKSLLSNMLRASRKMPLVFTDVTSVQGSGTIGTSNSLSANIKALDPSSIPGYFSADLGSTAGLSSTLSTSRNFNFTLASLNNEEFFKGFLTATTLEDLHFFISSNDVSDVLFSALIFDSIEIVATDGSKKLYLNRPDRPDYPQFKNLLYQLIDEGLMTETTIKQVKLGPVLSKDDFVKIMPEFSKLLQLKVMVQQVSAKPESYQLTIAAPSIRVCMNGPRDQRHYGKNMDCGKPPASVGQIAPLGSTSQQSTDDTIVIKLRSTREVFSYLGRLIALQSGPNPIITTIRSDDPGSTEEVPILIVNRGTQQSAESSFASTRFIGELYSVPNDASGYSIQVFDFLSVMVTMNKIPGSIPMPPGVLLR